MTNAAPARFEALPAQAGHSRRQARERQSIIGVHGEASTRFPIGNAMEKNLTLEMGNCNHRRYVPRRRDGGWTKVELKPDRTNGGAPRQPD